MPLDSFPKRLLFARSFWSLNLVTKPRPKLTACIGVSVEHLLFLRYNHLNFALCTQTISPEMHIRFISFKKSHQRGMY